MKSLLLLLLPVALGVDQHLICLANQRILGGQDSYIDEYPGVVALVVHFWREVSYGLVDKNITCAGSIISERWVLTAAHCVSKESPLQFRYVQVYPPEADGGSIQSEKVIVHEEYNLAHSNDIALIMLPYSMSKIFRAFKTVSLPLQGQELTSNEVTLVGWGVISTTDEGVSPESLQKLEHVPLNQSLCQEVGMSEAKVLCRYPTMTTGTACAGDSGGPIFMDGQVVGIVSITKEKPFGYISIDTRVSAFRDWIDSKRRFYEAAYE